MSIQNCVIYSKSFNKELTIREIRDLNLVVNEIAEKLSLTKEEVIKQYLEIIDNTQPRALQTSFYTHRPVIMNIC